MSTYNNYNVTPELYQLILQAGAHETQRLDGRPMLVLTTANDSIQKFAELVKEQYASVLLP